MSASPRLGRGWPMRASLGRTPTSTIGREAKENPTLAAKTFEAFDALP